MEKIDSEVIIDFTMAFRQLQYAKRRPTFGIKEFDNPDCGELYEDICTNNECSRLLHNQICDDTALDDFLSDSFIDAESNGLLHESSNENRALSEGQLIMLPFRVHGFSLRSRNWGPSKFPHVKFIADI